MQKHPNARNTINFIRFNGLYCPMSVMGIYDNHKAFGHDNQSYSSVSTGYMHPSAVKLLNHFPELKEDSTLYRFSVKFLRDLSNRMLFRVLPPRRKIGFLKYHLRRMVRLKLPKK
jgi:hypothetical protein